MGIRRFLLVTLLSAALPGPARSVDAHVPVDLTVTPFVVQDTTFEGDLKRYRFLLSDERLDLYRTVTNRALKDAWRQRYPKARPAEPGDETAVRARIVAVIPKLTWIQLMNLPGQELNIRLEVRLPNRDAWVRFNGTVSGAALNTNGVGATNDAVTRILASVPDSLTPPK